MSDTKELKGSNNKPQGPYNTDDVERSSPVEATPDAAKDPNVVDFDGPNDPENPMNWSTAKKTTAIAIVSRMTLLSYERSPPI